MEVKIIGNMRGRGSGQFDAATSLHLNNVSAFHHIKAHSRRGKVPTLSFFPQN
jgi:hypothetical protein